MSNTQFPDTTGEASVQAATDGTTAYVYYALGQGTTAAGYPAGLYTVDGSTGGVSGPYSFTLPGLGDQLSLLPNGERLFHATGLRTSTAQLLGPTTQLGEAVSTTLSGAQCPVRFTIRTPRYIPTCWCLRSVATTYPNVVNAPRAVEVTLWYAAATHRYSLVVDI
jgi:hypothetical protein